MKSRAGYVADWRNRTRDKMAKAFKNTCSICKRVIDDGSILQYHFYNPELMDKNVDFIINNFVRNPKSWIKIEESLKDCICICPICHRYVHNKKVDLPSSFIHYGEESERVEPIVEKYYSQVKSEEKTETES